MRLTATNIRVLTCPPGKSEQTFFDDDLPGFGLRTRASGAKSWLYQYAIAGRTKKIFLGAPNVVDAGKARSTAKDLAAQIRLGRDPTSEKVMSRTRAQETVAALLPRFLERQRARLKPRSYQEVERHLLSHAKPLHGLPVSGIDRRAVAKRLAEIAESSGPTASNRVRASLSAFFTWAARAGFIEANPVSYTDKALEIGARARVLSDAELGNIWRALGSNDYDAILKLLLLTGARRDELGSLRWTEVDLEAATITLPPARTKNSREHIIPLSPPALQVLDEARRQATDSGRDFVFGRGEGGFSGWSACKRHFDARLAAAGFAVVDWTLHDFRRSLSTRMHENFGLAPHLIELILAHASGHQGGVAGVYNRSSYLDERRRALLRWADHILALASGEPTTAQILKLR